MNNLIPFNMAPVAAGKLAIPAHILAAQQDDSSNITARASIPQLRFKGKVWTVDMAGDQNMLTAADGETPLAIVKLVVMDTNPNRSRAYYEGAFDPEKSAAPRCYSSDGVRPDADVKEPCANTCASCSMSVKGSKVTDNGKASTACTAFKRIAVVPSTQLDFEPLLLRLPQTSVWDGNNSENEQKGWYAFDQYLKFLAERGCTHTKYVVTACKFDPQQAYPKLLFKAEGWLEASDLAIVNARIADKSEEIGAIIGKASAAALKPLALASTPKLHVVMEEPQEEVVVKPVAKPAPKPAAKAAPKPQVVEVVEEGGEAAPAAPNALASVLGGWDD